MAALPLFKERRALFVRLLQILMRHCAVSLTVILACALCRLPTDSAPLTDQGGPSGVPQFHQLKIGGGGYVSGGESAPDGTMVIRSDTYGAYLRNGAAWVQVVNSDSMPVNTFFLDANGNYQFPQGVYEISVCPASTNDLVMHYNGYVFTSVNRGATWIKTSYVRDYLPKDQNQNDAYRMNQQKMAFDPKNCNIIYVGNPASSGGLFISINFGMTWSRAAGVSASVADRNGVYPGVTGIVFDRSSGTTNGGTNTIYAAVAGRGVYRSVNVGSTWSLLKGSPQYVESAVVVSGNYYAAADPALDVSGGNEATHLVKYNDHSWTTLVTDPNGVHAIAVDPLDSSHIVYTGGAGFLNQSWDAGVTWTGNYFGAQFESPTWQTSINRGSTEVYYLTIGNILYDPSGNNRIWITEGNGVAYTNTLTPRLSTSEKIIWHDATAGIENMVARQVIAPLGGVPIISVEDHQEVVLQDLNAYPTTIGVAEQGKQVAGWSLDAAKSSQTVVVALNNWISGLDSSGISNTGGLSWRKFDTVPTGSGSVWSGGVIAAASPFNIVVVPGQGATTPYCTNDGGSTWRPTTGLPTAGWPGSKWNNTKILAADYSNGNFYLYNQTNGLFTSTNGGCGWTLTNPAKIDAYYYQPTLIAVPGKPGNLFYTAGGVWGGTHPNTNPLYRSMNGGTTWSKVTNVEDVWAIGTGAAGTGENYPRVFLVGWANCGHLGVLCETKGSNPQTCMSGGTGYKYGIWLAKNNFGSIRCLMDFPASNFDEIVTMSGDQNDPTKVYFGFQGSSGGYGAEIN